MLIVTVLVALVAVLFGAALSSRHLLEERPPARLGIAGALHGIVGAASVALLWWTLRQPVRPGFAPPGTFAWTSFALLALTLLAGLVVLSFYLRRRQVPAAVVALHACLGIFGVVVLGAYFAKPVSFGH